MPYEHVDVYFKRQSFQSFGILFLCKSSSAFARHSLILYALWLKQKPTPKPQISCSRHGGLTLSVSLIKCSKRKIQFTDFSVLICCRLKKISFWHQKMKQLLTCCPSIDISQYRITKGIALYYYTYNTYNIIILYT